jgi:hypothetical protein
MTPARWLILLGCIVLFCGAVMHLVGYHFLMPVIANAGLDGRVLGAIKSVWLAFSIQFLVLSPAMVWISRRPGARSLLFYVALIPMIDAILMYHFVGPFIGAHVIVGGTLLLLAGVWLLPRGHTPAQ